MYKLFWCERFKFGRRILRVGWLTWESIRDQLLKYFYTEFYVIVLDYNIWFDETSFIQTNDSSILNNKQTRTKHLPTLVWHLIEIKLIVWSADSMPARDQSI